jgi:hypothetical protein
MENSQISWIEYIQILGPILVGLAGVLLAFYVNYQALISKKREDERNEIYKKINEFYSPFEQLRKKSFRLYGLFKGTRGDDFRTLPALLKGEKFNDNEQELLEEIINIDQRLENLIIDKSGLVDQQNLRDLLAKAATHFHIISQAYKGRLKGEPERFADYVFPRELDEKVSEQINLLKARLKELNQ